VETIDCLPNITSEGILAWCYSITIPPNPGAITPPRASPGLARRARVASPVNVTPDDYDSSANITRIRSRMQAGDHTQNSERPQRTLPVHVVAAFGTRGSPA
jgi:hypothetical protein